MIKGAAAVVVILLLVAACGSSEASVEAFCDQMESMADADAELAAVDLSDSDAVTQALTRFRIEFTRLADVSPDEIVRDAEIVARFGTTVADAALTTTPDDPFDTAAALAAATASEPAVSDAVERLAAYSARRCTAAP